MTVLQPVLTNTFDYISRFPGVAIDSILLFEEGTKQSESIPLAEILSVTNEWYDTVSFNDVNTYLKDGYRYLLSIFGVNNELLWQDVVFCTSQAISTFTVNDGKYIYNQSNNQFIMYGQ
jgi:hypothetical protein